MKKSQKGVSSRLLSRLAKSIKDGLHAHIVDVKRGAPQVHPDKDTVRNRHGAHRRECLEFSSGFICKNYSSLIKHFASGREIEVERIAPKLQLVSSGTEEARLFRLASLTWSVPVSEGYGRRMRFLVWDSQNDKLIGLIAVGDPVFNLRVRDQLIGWSANDRKLRLVHVMDAYVLGAVPPYNLLLGGKLVASLVRTKELKQAFFDRYSKTSGIISGLDKRSRLVMVTTSSALGRSSVYNRLKLNGTLYFQSIGFTAGFGHFHVPSPLFDKMRTFLTLIKHPYSNGNRFGNGPNWKFRAIRAALESLGISRTFLQHGIHREVFVSQLARNAFQILRGEHQRPNYEGLLSVEDVGALAVERWMSPRALRRPGFVNWRREQVADLLEISNGLSIQIADSLSKEQDVPW